MLTNSSANNKPSATKEDCYILGYSAMKIWYKDINISKGQLYLSAKLQCPISEDSHRNNHCHENFKILQKVYAPYHSKQDAHITALHFTRHWMLQFISISTQLYKVLFLFVLLHRFKQFSFFNHTCFPSSTHKLGFTNIYWHFARAAGKTHVLSTLTD